MTENPDRSSPARLLILCAFALVLRTTTPARCAESKKDSAYAPHIAAASNEGEQQMASFIVPEGLQVKLWAAEPMVANPVCLTVDEQGRVYVAETYRIHHGVEDDREHMDWLDDDLASTTVDARRAMLHKHLKEKVADYTKEHDRVRLLEDRSGGGKADHVSLFADSFHDVIDGIGAGLLARRGDVYFTCIPSLYRLRDTRGTGTADVRQILSTGYGVRVSFLGHDLHGLIFGPDGKLYFSLGDRGFHVTTADGRTIADPDTGGVFRCNPDGTGLELFAYGLRNPQKLAFDEYGNLFTCDNNSDSGDRARWVYIVEGSDNGWRMPYQYLEGRGPFNREKLWYPQFAGQAAYIVPPIAWVADGPSGLVYYPGTGWSDKWRDRFFLCDFRGASGTSGVRSIALKPKGASFELTENSECIWHILATDVAWGPSGDLNITDWVEGWDGCGKGRVYRVVDPAKQQDPQVLEVKRLIAEGMSKRSSDELIKLLGHADMRVRQEAQFSLAERVVRTAGATAGSSSSAALLGKRAVAPVDGEHLAKQIAESQEIIKALTAVAASNDNQLAIVHAIWALGQIGDRHRMAIDALLPLTADKDAEIRAQVARVLGDLRYAPALDRLIALMKDASPRVRHLAAIAVGKLGRSEAIPAAIAMLRENDDKDAVIRHSAVMALVGSHDPKGILAATGGEAPAVKLGVVVALRRLKDDAIAQFLDEENPLVALEAARAINDVPLDTHLPALAKRIDAPPAGDEATRDAFLRRVLNANFRLGETANAIAVAQFAGSDRASDALRIEALRMLADWAKPSPRDRLTNFWRPLARRSPDIAAHALEPELSSIMAASNAVRQAAMETAAKLGIKEIAPKLAELVHGGRGGDPFGGQLPAEIRIQALKALYEMRDERLDAAVAIAVKDSDSSLRSEGVRVLASLHPAEAIDPLTKALEQVTDTHERQSALATLGSLNFPAADTLLARWLDKLLARQVPPEIQLDLLDAAGKRGTPELKEKLARFEAARPNREPIDAFRESLVGGNAERGRKIFFERAEVNCLRCHTIDGKGGQVGPDLSKIGTEKKREYLLEAIVDPNKTIAKGFETVVLSLDDGRQVAGILKGETDKHVQLMSPEAKVVTVPKSAIESRTTGKSAMPQDVIKTLTKSDIRDLVEFLAGLSGTSGR
jgi:quinoprotein glucose dehydrogenase